MVEMKQGGKIRLKKMSRLKEGEKAAGVSTIIIFLLALAEALIGLLSGSIVLVIDALHNAADSVTSFVSWFGLKISQRKPDEKFPYGYYKAESLATLFASVAIIYAAVELMLEGYSKLFALPELTMPLHALSIALVSAIVSYFLARYMKRVGMRVGSQSLAANAQERLTHVFSSAVVFIAILLTLYRIPYVEGAVAMFFSLLVFRIGIFTGKDSVFALMDVSPSKEIEAKVKSVLNEIAGIESFENLKLRKSGPFIFGEVAIKIRKHVSVKRAHEIADNIESRIKDAVEQIDSFTIHVEPYETERQKLALPIKDNRGLDSELMEQFGRANYFIFVTINKKTGKVESNYVKENPHRKKLVRAGFAATGFIIKEKMDVLITKEMGAISFHTSRDHLVDVYKAEGRTVGEAVDKFIKGKLKRLTKPTKTTGERLEVPERAAEKEAEFRRGYGRRYGRGYRGRGRWWEG